MIRPEVSQIVIDEFTKIIDSQDDKGIQKYGRTIDDAKDGDYSWMEMASEEIADMFKYLVKEIIRLRKETKTINHLCQEAYKTAKSKGWHDEPRETGTLLALIHAEVSEALEADRKGDFENFTEELADVCIRIFDLSECMGIDLEQAILKKMEFNKTRAHMHGGKRY